MMDKAAERELIDEAIRVRANAYAPFSKFLVGAAVQTTDGQVFGGVNVENSSYGLTCCAERVAVFSAVAAGKQEFAAIAIASAGKHAPCGACRQVLAEFRVETILLVDADNPDDCDTTSIDALLPSSFRFPEP